MDTLKYERRNTGLRVVCWAVLYLAATIGSGMAHSPSHMTWYLASAKYVCLARVTSIEGDRVTFEVTANLRGNPDHTLRLSDYPGSTPMAMGTEWLLISCAWGFKDCVGWAIKGDCGWIPCAVIHDQGKTYIADWSFPHPDGTKGYTLDYIKHLAEDGPKKP